MDYAVRLEYYTVRLISRILFSASKESSPHLQFKILQLIEDLIFHWKSPQELLSLQCVIFYICIDNCITMNSKRWNFSVKRVKWCGRLTSEEGIILDTSRMSALTTMKAPTTGADLQKFLCETNWMSNYIQEFTTLTDTLSAILEEVKKYVGSEHSEQHKKYNYVNYHRELSRKLHSPMSNKPSKKPLIWCTQTPKSFSTFFTDV